jgi:hypothetical protein
MEGGAEWTNQVTTMSGKVKNSEPCQARRCSYNVYRPDDGPSMRLCSVRAETGRCSTVPLAEWTNFLHLVNVEEMYTDQITYEASELVSRPPADSPRLEVVSDVGSGRAFVLLVDDEEYTSLAVAVAGVIAAKNRSIVLRSAPVNSTNWSECTSALQQTLKDLSVRQGSFICFGAGATLVQNLVLGEPKSVRSLVLIDSSSRPHPTMMERCVDRVESLLPLGLPLRLGSGGFNVRSYLHRMRCPILVVTTQRAGAFLQDDANTVAACAPTAWRIMLGTREAEEQLLSEAILNFQDTPAKCPQKNL